ncbi:Ig-like domain-containing protein [Paenibacillus daejeonensis]|uniref:Ig-like domain-containing protein n=1 Tax=Paenibacillus daejeonensis TaxID=135193 RepID=UPI0003A1D751|nr:Ig-like domain-containing protein [Paenibacillus daejeonensis]
MNGQFKKTMKVQARKGLLLMLCFLLLPVVSLVAPGGVAQAEPDLIPPSAVTTVFTGDHYGFDIHDGYLYMASRDTGKITRIKIDAEGNVEAGAQLEDFITDLSYAMSVAFDSEGNLYYTKDASGINKVSADKLPTNGQSISASTPNFSQRVAVHGGYNHNMAFDSQDNLYFTNMAFEPRRMGVYRVKKQNLGTNLPAEQVFEYVDSIEIQQLTFDVEDNLYFAIGRKIYTVNNEVVSGTSISTNEVQEFQELQTGQIAYGLRVFQNKFYYSDMSTVKRIEAVDLTPVQPEPEKWVTVNTGSTDTLSKIIYANGRYMAVGDNGVIAYSVDGDQWSSVKPYTIDSLMALMYQNGHYFAAGSDGIVLRSAANLTSWERMQVNITEPQPKVDPPYDYYDFVPSGESGFLLVGSQDAMVVYDEYEDEIGHEIEWMDFSPDNGTAVIRKVDNTSSVQVAVGQNMLLRFMESPDDNREGEAEPTEAVWTTWTFTGEDPDLHLNGVASFSKEISETLKEERYVVVGDDGLIFTSTTGKTWTKVISPTEESLFSVRWIDGRFYAVGGGGTLISSEDGEEWKTHLLAGEPEFDFYDIAKGPAGLIIVGANGQAVRQEIVRVAGVVLSGEDLILEGNEDIHTLTLIEGRPAVTLEAIVHPEDAVNKDVVWSLTGQSEEGVATLEDGVVTPLKEGTALITVTTVDGGFTSSAKLVVKSSLIPVTGVTLVELEEEQYTLTEGGFVSLVANVLPSDATDPEVEWSSSNENVVKVSDNGTVTAIGLGQATITVKTLDGGFEASADFTVVRPATGVTVSPEMETLAVGGPSVTLTATVTPTGSTNGAVTWTSNDSTIATVNSAGVVTPVSQGTATITATTQGGLTATAQITVVQLVSGIVVNPSTLSLDEQASDLLTATVAPVNATNPAVTWTTSDPEVATVDSNGLVTAVNKGTATITATSADGVHKNSSTVTVIRRAASVSINPSSLNLHENGATAVLTATVAPVGTNNTNVTWRSADTSIAEVNANGVVTPKNIGSTTITVRTVDGGHEQSIPVTVGPNVASDVHLNLYLLNMKQGGKTEQLIATVTPSNASNKNVTWKSEDPSVATVVNGLVTAVGGGSTYITVTTEDGGFTKQARVIVEQTIWPVTGVSTNKSSLELTVGQPGEKLIATVAPANATNKAVTWSSSDSAIATVNADGLVAPVAAGKTTVKVTTVDGNNSASVDVEVKAAPQPPANGGGGGGGAVIVAPPANPTEEITGVVDGGAASGAGLSSFVIKRTSGSNGAKQDAIALEANKTKEAADKAKAAGLPIIRVVIPDAKDEVSDTTVTLPLSALQHLKNDEIGLELSTANARIVIGSESLAGQNQELYFRLTPLKTAGEQAQVESRAGAQAVVQQTVGEGSFDLVGRPVTIETNMKGQPVEIILPLAATQLPSNAAEREAWLSRLVIFIEHSDGERVVVQPQVVTDASGQVGLSFEINKFSTFSILEIQPAAETEPEVGGRHEAYMSGYEDGTFRPSRQVTRAELAAILARLYAAAAAEPVSTELTDIDSHWAEASIRAVVAGGYMQGYPDGTFQPNRVLSRAEIAAILARVQGLTHTGVATFGDVASGHWAEGYIGAVQQAGLMTGYEGNEFRPGQGVTRAEVVVIVNRVLRRGPLTDVTEPSWSDVSVSHWAFGHIEEASRTHDYIVVDGVEASVQ